MPATLPGQMVVTDASQDVADFHVAVPKRPAPVITSLSEVDIKLDKLAEKLDVCIKELSNLRFAQRPREVDSGHLKAPEAASNTQLTPRSPGQLRSDGCRRCKIAHFGEHATVEQHR